MYHHYRITKYDPRFRTRDGAYTRDEWTFFAQVGTRVTGSTLTMAEYVRVESLYVSALNALLREAGVSRLEVRGLCLPKRLPASLSVWRRRHVIGITHALAFAQLCLRERIWGQLVAPRRAYVHFDWDYYMYVGLSRRTPHAIDFIRSSGLFVESFRSPERSLPAAAHRRGSEKRSQ
jgi:hypothetical protein